MASYLVFFTFRYLSSFMLFYGYIFYQSQLHGQARPPLHPCLHRRKHRGMREGVGNPLWFLPHGSSLPVLLISCQITSIHAFVCFPTSFWLPAPIGFTYHSLALQSPEILLTCSHFPHQSLFIYTGSLPLFISISLEFCSLLITSQYLPAVTYPPVTCLLLPAFLLDSEPGSNLH